MNRAYKNTTIVLPSRFNITHVNPLMTTTENTTLEPEAKSSKNDKTATGAGLGGAVVFIVVVIIIIIVRRKMRKKKDEEFDSDVESGVASSGEDDNDDNVFNYEKAGDVSLKDIKRSRRKVSALWEGIDPGIRTIIESLQINTKQLTLKRVVGKGQFGCVYEATLAKQIRGSNDYGELTHTKVAVKTVKGNDVNSETIEDFLQEGLIMKDFHHRNVLTLLGVVISNDGMPMIVLPYMVNGNIKKYVETPDLAITVRDLLGFGLQVAEGMQYLAEQKFVHRDLAARNCMLDEDMVVKVADFGLSRDIYTKDYYASSDKQRKLPVKWMAIECLTKSVYTTKSDVWAFGVFLWELLTRGSTPYPDITNWDVCNYVKAGRRMHQPESCPEEVYTMILQCWEKEPDDRPSFSQLSHDLQLILSASETPTGEDMNHSYANLYLNVDVGGNTPLEEGVLGLHGTSLEEVEVLS